MSHDRRNEDDIYVGILVAVLHPRTGNITWGFKEYDPNNKTDFPVPLQFREAGRLIKPNHPGRVFKVENEDALVVFVDHGCTHPMISKFVDLDFETGKVADPDKPELQVQMIGESRVNGIPQNMPADEWREVFSEGRPAVLFRQKGGQVNEIRYG